MEEEATAKDRTAKPSFADEGNGPTKAAQLVSLLFVPLILAYM